MERCDFASITTTIRNYLMDGSFDSQPDFLYSLFDAYAQETGACFDNGLSNKWLNGLVRVSADIGRFYHDNPEQRAKLAETLRKNIFTRMPDSAMAVREVYELLIRDESVSEREKGVLCGDYPDGENADDAAFLADVLVFGMVRRPFLAHDVRKPALHSGNCSPVLSSYISDEGLPKPCKHFCGRAEELEALHDMLVKKGKVFLCGIPGIGKSELAKAYAKVHKKDYTNILYLTYSGDLKRDIADLMFMDDRPGEKEAERFRRHNRFLRTLKPDTLLIIDNFNTSADGDESLSMILKKYRCRVLLTTRNNPPEQNCFLLKEITDAEALFGMCAELYGGAKENRSVLEEIIDTVHGHTLAVELAARLLETGILEPCEVLAKLQTERASFDATDKIRISKDEQQSRATYYDHIHTLFALFRLSALQREIMRSLSLIPLSGITAKLFGKWLQLQDLNQINDMVEMGFITPRPARKISLHPMTRDVSVSEFPPSVTSCHTMLESIQNLCKSYAEEIPDCKTVFQTVENVVFMAEKDDMSFYPLLLEEAVQRMNKYRYERGEKLLLHELDQLMQDEAVATPYHRSVVLSLHSHAEKDTEKAIKLMQEAVSIMPDIGEESAALAVCMNGNLASLYMRSQNTKMIKQHIMAMQAILNRYNLMGANKQYIELMNWLAMLENQEDFKRAVDELCNAEWRLHKRTDHRTLKELGGVLKSMAYMDVATGHKERAELSVWKVLYVYSVLYADDPAYMEHEMKQIVEICKEHRLRVAFPAVSPI